MEAIFLACFAFGAVFTLLTTLMGLLGAGLHGLGNHLHLPGGGHGLHGAGHASHGVGHHVGIAHGAANGIAHGATGLGNAANAAHHAVHGATHGARHVLPQGHAGSLTDLALGTFLNPSALLVGISMFGGLGYIALHFLFWPVVFALALAVPAGVAGAALVGAFMAKLRQDAGTMHDQDYSLAGTLATVTLNIHDGQVGEIVFVMGGVRRAEGARAFGGGSIAKGTQVVVLGYERGLAMVEPASQLTEGLSTSQTDLEAPHRRQQQTEDNG
jgi:membrane protein implicated in regulation of membrane protease activity